MNMNAFLRDRKKAFLAAVLHEDWDALKRYCRKYGIPIPKDERVMKAGCYKAVQECTDISEDVKVKAAKRCIALGFFPFVRK